MQFGPSAAALFEHHNNRRISNLATHARVVSYVKRGKFSRSTSHVLPYCALHMGNKSFISLANADDDEVEVVRG